MTLAQLAVALAGFTGVVIALGDRPDSLHPVDRVRLYGQLSSALVATMLAMIPFAFELGGLHGSSLWRASSATALAVMVPVPVIATRMVLQLDVSNRRWVLIGDDIPGYLASGLALACTIVLWGLMGSNCIRALLDGVQWAYFVGVLVAVFFSGFMFGLLLFNRPRS